MPAKVVSSQQAATNMHIVTVDVGKAIAATYKKGGQYLQMRVGDGKPAYLAVANSPEASADGKMEFLIKYFPDSNHADIISCKEGDEVCNNKAEERAQAYELLREDCTVFGVRAWPVAAHSLQQWHRADTAPSCQSCCRCPQAS